MEGERESEKQHDNKVSAAKMRMLRWTSGKTKRDTIRNDTMCVCVWERERERVNVAHIVEKIVKNRLIWFVHVEIRPANVVVRRVYREVNLKYCEFVEI